MTASKSLDPEPNFIQVIPIDNHRYCVTGHTLWACKNYSAGVARLTALKLSCPSRPPVVAQSALTA